MYGDETQNKLIVCQFQIILSHTESKVRYLVFQDALVYRMHHS
jgi:hypothetical protein